MTALEIYREDRLARRDPAKRQPRQEYFHRLRDALLSELTQEGRSDLLEEMLAESTAKSLPALEYAALQECAAVIVDGRRMKDASQFLPHVLRGDQPLAWAELDAGASFRVDDPQMPEILKRLRYISYQLVSARDQTPAADEQRAVSREIAGLRAVNHALESDNAALRAERDQLRERLAALEEGVISRQLQTKINARRFQVEEGLEREMARKRQEAEGSLRLALRAAAFQEQQFREEAEREASARQAERAAAMVSLRDEVLEALARQMQCWQQALAGADYRFLARSYAEMRGAIDREVPEMLGAAQQQGAEGAFVERLAQLGATLNGRMRRMEQAMLQLGLQPFQPRVGEAFDEKRHSPASAMAADAPLDAAEVAAVESPGVLLLQGDGGTETLVRAVVQTRRRAERSESRRPRAGGMAGDANEAQ